MLLVHNDMSKLYLEILLELVRCQQFIHSVVESKKHEHLTQNKIQGKQT